jgi:hypothetical protein
MSFLYPRTIDLHRPASVATDSSGNPTAGFAGYSGTSANTDASAVTGETVIATGLRCGIMARGMGRVMGLDLTAADSPGPVQWIVTLPKSALAKGAVRDRDILVDDEGYRYKVAAAEWTFMGYALYCIRLEA